MEDLQAVFTILGCGTSTGVPVPGCKCEICTSGHPKNSRTRTSALVSLPSLDRNILIDAGPDLRQQALRENIHRIDSVLFTHAHADHILGCDDLRVFNFVKRAPIEIYGLNDTLEAIQNVFGYIFQKDPNYMGGKIADLIPTPISGDETFECEGIHITPLKLEHGSMPVLGYRFGNLVYATDCKRFSGEALSLAKGAEILIVDGLRFEDHYTHMRIDEAIELAQELNVKRTVLVHMTHSIDYEKDGAKLPKDVEFAFDGLKIPFSAEIK